MRNIDDGDALGLEIRDDAEQDIDLGRAQGRSRLVHDENARVARDGLGDLDQLLLADHQVFDFRARIDRRLQTFEESARLAFLFGVVDPSRSHDLVIDENVLGDREIAEQVQLLEHHADAVRHRVAGVDEGDRLSVEQNAPGGRLFDAGDHLDQRRLARAVLANQDVYRATADLEVGVLHRDRSGIDFRTPSRRSTTGCSATDALSSLMTSARC